MEGDGYQEPSILYARGPQRYSALRMEQVFLPAPADDESDMEHTIHGDNKKESCEHDGLIQNQLIFYNTHSLGVQWYERHSMRDSEIRSDTFPRESDRYTSLLGYPLRIGDSPPHGTPQPVA